MVFIYVLYKIQQAASYFKHQNGKKISHCRNNSKIQSTNCKQKKTKVKLIPLIHTYITAQWHNSPQIDMLRQSDTLCWLRSNQALFPYLNVLCLTVKQPLQFYCSWIASMGNRTYALLHSWQACQKRSLKWIEPRHHVA